MADRKHPDQFDIAYASYVAEGKSDESLQALLKLSETYIRRIAYSKVRQHTDDVTQDALLALWRSLPRYNPALAGMKHYVRLAALSAINRHLATVYSTPPTCRLDDVTIPPDDSDDYSGRGRLYEVFGEASRLLESLLCGDTLADAARYAGMSRKAARCAIARAKMQGQISLP